MSDEEQQVWRVDCHEGAVSVTVWRTEQRVWTSGDAFLGVSPRMAVLSHALHHRIIGTILAPGEPTRAELLARIAEMEAVIAKHDAASADADAADRDASAAKWRKSAEDARRMAAWEDEHGLPMSAESSRRNAEWFDAQADALEAAR